MNDNSRHPDFDPKQPESSQPSRYGRESRPVPERSDSSGRSSGGTPAAPVPPAPRPGLRRNVALGVGLGALGLAALVTGGMALTASRTQDSSEQFARTLSGALNRSGVVHVESSRYQRGLTSSTQVMKLVLDDQESGKPVGLIVTNHIQHGPLPGFQAVGQALVDTEFRFEDPGLQAQFDRAFPGRKPQLRTLVGLDGGTHTTLDVPQGQITEQGGVVSWQALKGSLDVQGLSTRADMTWPGLNIKGPDVQGQIGPFTLKSDLRRTGAEDQLGVGKGQFKLGNMTFTSGDGETVILKNFTIDTESRQNGKDHYDAQARYLIGEINGGGERLQNLQLQLGLRHLARDPLNRIIKLLNDVQAGAQAGFAASEQAVAAPTQPAGLPELTPAQQQQLEADLLALVKGRPELSLDRLSLSRPGGDVVLRARLAVPGAARLSGPEIRSLMDTPAALAGVMELDASLQAPRRALEELLSLVGGETPLGGVDELIGGGLLRESGGVVSTELRFADGQMRLNGQDLGAF